MKKQKRIIKSLFTAGVSVAVAIPIATVAVACSSQTQQPEQGQENVTKEISIKNATLDSFHNLIKNIDNANIMNEQLKSEFNALDSEIKDQINDVTIVFDNNDPYRNVDISITLNPNNKYLLEDNSQATATLNGNILQFKKVKTKVFLNSELKNVSLKIGPSSIRIKQNSRFEIKVDINGVDVLNQFYPEWTLKWMVNDAAFTNSKGVYTLGDKNETLKINNPESNNSGIYVAQLWLDKDKHFIDSNGLHLIYVNPNDIEQTPNRQDFSNDAYTMVGTYYDKILNNNLSRPQNVATYQTELWTRYHNEYNFVYPGYNRNYESTNGSIFTNSRGEKFDALDPVWRERVPYDASNPPQIRDAKYNNERWIVNEIAKGTFKKHPAADNFYESSTANIPAVVKEFEISTYATGATSLGLYVPAGEAVTIEFDKETYDLMKKNRWNSLKFAVNGNYWDNYEVPNQGQISNRYPYLRSYFPLSMLDDATRSLKIGSVFGGGLTIVIDAPLFVNGNPPYHKRSSSIKFKVSGAIPCIQYVDGYTTEAEWNKQIDLFKQQKIAPIIQADTVYFNLSLPSTGIGKIGHVDVNEFMYPKDNFKKWNDFVFLSFYHSGQDINRSYIRKLEMLFCDDIWGGAAAWGGGNYLYAPLDWGSTGIFKLKKAEEFSAGNIWGMLHETNHNYQQDQALFKKRGHGETNQNTVFNLAAIGDVGRYRNEWNYSGESDFTLDRLEHNGLSWTKLTNPYINIANVVKNNQSDEYPLYANLVYTLGYKNYADYVRWDVRNHRNTMTGWTGLEEIKTLSEKFKINFWPAFKHYGQWWSDTWPQSYDSASEAEKKIIDNLKKYPALDFVGNFYATGNYFYNSVDQEFIYGGDYISPYEVFVNQPTQMNLNKYIISNNKNFVWDQIEFPETTKLGSRLLYDSSSRILTYYPDSKNVGMTDEFDITIKPGVWNYKPANYVPAYKFKIKLRLIANAGHVQSFDISNTGTNKEKLDKLSATKNATSTVPYTRNGDYIFGNNQFAARKIKYKFVAPEKATYQFYAKWDDLYRLYVNDQQVFESLSWTNKHNKVYEVSLEKGQVLTFEHNIINNDYIGGFDFYVTSSADRFIDLFDNIILPDLGNEYNVTNILQQKYISRRIDYSIFDSNITSNFNETKSDGAKYLDPQEYDLTAHGNGTGQNIENLDKWSGENWYEVWNDDYGQNQAAVRINMNTTNKQKVDIGSLAIGSRTNNHYNARPTNINIKMRDDYNNEIVIYNGEFPSRGDDYSIIDFDKIYQTNNLEINMYNKKQNGISLNFIHFIPDKFIKQSNTFSFNNINMVVSNEWEYFRNNENNVSNINTSYVKTDRTNATIEFVLNDVQNFEIIGQKNINNGSFDLYINDELYKTVSTSSQNRIDNIVLTKYVSDHPKLLKIKIVSKEDKPLYLNFVNTYSKKNVTII